MNHSLCLVKDLTKNRERVDIFRIYDIILFQKRGDNYEIKGSHYQTSDYGILMSEIGYDYDLIGMVNEYGEVLAASLILIKKIGLKAKYGYAPKGFVLDYFNQSLLKKFTESLQEYYSKKNVIFIKLNPEIAVAEIDLKSKAKTYNWNNQIADFLQDNNYIKFKEKLVDISKTGVLGVEMETNALYINALMAGKNAIAMFTVSDNPILCESIDSKTREIGLNKMIEIALELAIKCEKEDMM